jgi:hypothetical protein
MDERDVALRNQVYRLFVELGRAPRAEELGDDVEEIEAGLRRLHHAHALVLDRLERPRIRMANPFSAVPTPHRTQARGRWWYANCGWDAFGVLAALHEDGRIESSCPDCAEPLALEVRGGRPEPADAVFHVLVPARGWWEDIVFT